VKKGPRGAAALCIVPQTLHLGLRPDSGQEIVQSVGRVSGLLGEISHALEEQT
jgi:hypothetical protein